MSGFDPGEGWRRLPIDEIVDRGTEVLSYSTGSGIRTWVREAPVPPLPTATWTIIRAMFREDELPDVFVCLGDSRWHNTGYTQHYDPDDLRSRIASFEVLAEPVLGRVPVSYNGDRLRIEQTKAVLARVRAYVPNIDSTLARVGREFGVTS